MKIRQYQLDRALNILAILICAIFLAGLSLHVVTTAPIVLVIAPVAAVLIWAIIRVTDNAGNWW